MFWERTDCKEHLPHTWDETPLFTSDKATCPCSRSLFRKRLAELLCRHCCRKHTCRLVNRTLAKILSSPWPLNLDPPLSIKMRNAPSHCLSAEQLTSDLLRSGLPTPVFSSSFTPPQKDQDSSAQAGDARRPHGQNLPSVVVKSPPRGLFDLTPHWLRITLSSSPQRTIAKRAHCLWCGNLWTREPGETKTNESFENLQLRT